MRGQAFGGGNEEEGELKRSNEHVSSLKGLTQGVSSWAHIDN